MKNLTLFFGRTIAISLIAIFGTTSLYAQKGSGNVIKESRNVGSFNAIKVGGAFDVYLRMGDKEDVTVVADDNIINNISTTVSDGKLRIKTTEEIKNPTELKIYVTAKKLNDIDISGACDLDSKNTIVSDELKIKTSGASDIDISIQCTKLKIFTSGASDIKMNGSANYVTIDASGASTIKGEGLNSNDAYVESSGASTVKIGVSEVLEAKASGASTVLYKGNPRLSVKESGASDIKKL